MKTCTGYTSSNSGANTSMIKKKHKETMLWHFGAQLIFRCFEVAWNSRCQLQFWKLSGINPLVLLIRYSHQPLFYKVFNSGFFHYAKTLTYFGLCLCYNEAIVDISTVEANLLVVVVYGMFMFMSIHEAYRKHWSNRCSVYIWLLLSFAKNKVLTI